LSLSPDYITRFTHGKGCFTLHITQKSSRPFGICMTPSFSISQNTTSRGVLLDIQEYFQCGMLRVDRRSTKYEVRRLGHLREIICPFFHKYPLRTEK
jgi:hypothetical protein